jgi:hypothetical protein
MPHSVEDCVRIMLAIKDAIDRLPQGTEAEPLPARDLNLVIDAGETATLDNVMFLQKAHGDMFHDLQVSLGYKSGWVVNTETKTCLQLFGDVMSAPPTLN